MLQYLQNKEDREAFIDKYDNFLFDCDGKWGTKRIKSSDWWVFFFMKKVFYGKEQTSSLV
jgi:hypothetical protein